MRVAVHACVTVTMEIDICGPIPRFRGTVASGRNALQCCSLPRMDGMVARGRRGGGERGEEGTRSDSKCKKPHREIVLQLVIGYLRQVGAVPQGRVGRSLLDGLYKEPAQIGPSVIGLISACPGQRYAAILTAGHMPVCGVLLSLTGSRQARRY